MKLVKKPLSFLMILSCVSITLAQTNHDIPFLVPRRGYSVELSPRLDGIWPGGKYWNIKLWDIKDRNSGVEREYWDKIAWVIVDGDTLYDDGQHLDGEAGDLFYGYFSLDDDHISRWPPTMVDILFVDGSGTGIIIDYEMMDAAPLPSFPEPVFPSIGESIGDTRPSFRWERVEGADDYGVIVWGRMPSPGRFTDNIIWMEGEIPGDTDFVSMQDAPVELERGRTYYWAVWAADWTQREHEGYYGGTFPYYVVDISWFQVDVMGPSGESVVEPSVWGQIKASFAR